MSEQKKYDIIIGNPPYEGKYTPLYLQILEKVIPIAKKVIWLCPSQWVKSFHYTQGAEEIRGKVGKNLVSHKHINNPFADVNTANEIGIYTFQYDIQKPENYKEIFWEKFSNIQLAKSIFKKFKNYKDNVSNHVERSNKTILSGNWCNICRIRGHFRESKPCWDWVTLFSEENRNNFIYKIGTHSNHINFDTIEECKNFVKYTESDIIYFSIYCTKDNNSQTPPMLSMIPWFGDYTHPWTEEMIQKELGITDEELEYIHDEMKDFGWKVKEQKNSSVL